MRNILKISIILILGISFNSPALGNGRSDETSVKNRTRYFGFAKINRSEYHDHTGSCFTRTCNHNCQFSYIGFWYSPLCRYKCYQNYGRNTCGYGDSHVYVSFYDDCGYWTPQITTISNRPVIQNRPQTNGNNRQCTRRRTGWNRNSRGWNRNCRRW